MNGALKRSWKNFLVLAMTCVFSASTMGGLYQSYSGDAEALRGNSAGSSSVSAEDGEAVPVNRLTGISDVSFSNGYALNAEDELPAGVIYDDNDVITVIVKLKDQSLLSKATYDMGMDVDEFALTEEGVRYNTQLEKSRDGFIRTHSSKILSVGYEYSTIFNGFAANIYYKSLSALEKDPNVESVLISETYNKPLTVTENDVNVYDTGIYDSSDIDYDGSGTVVAILDTGLDYTHTAFQNQPTGQLALTMDDVDAVFDELAAKQLDAANEDNVQQLRAEDLYYSDKVPFMYDYADSDWDVYPVNDHGTHVAGIIAGKDDVITGVATQAQLAIFKVFGNEDEGAPQEAILAALNDAILLGVDAINMSLGSSCGFSRATDEDATNELYDAIKETGICLLVAASNSYSSAQGSTNGDTNLASNPDSATIGSPSTYDAAMSVASISGVKTKYIVANGEEEIYFTEAAALNGDTKDFVGELLGGKSEGTYEYVIVPGVGSDSNYASIDVEGKIAVVRRGVTTFEEKIKAAERRGAVGVIIYNNVSGVISMSVGTAKIPACSIQMDYGNYLVEKGSGTMHFSTEYLAGPFMSNFSSWGPKADLELAPDITAHGGDIYSAVRGGYDTYSGTSMACPNMAGATILVREYVKQNYPELSNYEITELTYQLMMSTATIANNEEGNPYSPRKQGAGLADIASAIDTAAYLYVEGQNKTKLSLGDDVEKTGVYTMTFHLKNLSDQAVSYRVNPVVMTETMSSDGKTVAEKAYMLDDVTSSVSVKNGTVKGNIVTVTGYADCEITVVVTLSDADKAYLDANFENGMYVEGFIELESMNADGIGLNIPFLAFYGDWTRAPLFDVTEYEVGAEQEDDSILEDDKLEPDVYATIPMGGFRYSTGGDEYEETYYYLGGFGYTLADGYEMPAIIEDKAAISSSMDATYSLYCISAGLLRNAKYAEMKIVDSLTGEVVFSKVSENNRKSYSNGGEQVGGYVDVGFYVNEYNLENNRKYTYSMTCYLDYDKHEQNNRNNTFSFSFYVDNEAPTLVEEDTRIRVTTNTSGEITSRALNMYAYDNHYIQGYFIYTCSSISPDGTVNDQEALIDGCIPVDGERNETTSISLDITNNYADILEKGGKLYVQLIDYAKNSSTYMIDLNGTVKDVTDIQIKNGKDSYTLRINKQVNLNTFIDVYPQNTYVKDLIWTSSNEQVAIVKDGLVTGVSAGEAIITVANGTGEGAVSQQIKITVSETGGSEQITLSSLKLKTQAVSLERGESYELTVELQPYNLTEDITLTWSSTSSYFSFAVDENDQTHVTITALNSGSGTLVVRADGKTISASCRITVKEEFEVEGRYLKSYTGRGDENGVVEIPDDLGILYIYRYAFFGNEYIKKIIIPEGVEEVEEAAIYNCTNLEEVVFPESIKVVHRFAVAWNPELTTVTGSIPSIGELAFYNCPNLSTIDFSRTVFIEENAFFGSSSLERVDLSNVVYVGPYSFGLCPALVEVITGTNTVISRYAFANCTGLTRVEINSSRIGSAAFIGCSALKSVTFNQPVETLDYGAFYGCVALEEVIFRSSARVIDDLAFGNCISLTSFYIPAGVEDLGENAFGGCSSLEKVLISKDAKLTSIGQGVFQGAASLTAFELESGAKYLSVQDGILYDKAQRTVKLVPFGYTGDVALPDTVTEVGGYAFSMLKNIGKVTASGVEAIGTGAFLGCEGESIQLGTSVKTVGDLAFSGCTLAGMTLTEGMESIGSEAFAEYVFAGGALTLPESLTYVGEKAFAYSSGYTSVAFNSTLTEVSDYMFYGCSGVKSVSFGNVREIGDYAFYGCTGLTSLAIPETVTKLGVGSFRGCRGLSSVTLPDTIAEISAEAFYDCRSLRTLSLPDSVTLIGEYAFYGSALSELDFNNTEAVGAYAFVGTELTEINAAKLQTIGSAAFGELSLTSVELPEATEVYSYAFYQCKTLTYFYAPKLVTLGAFALSGTKLSSFASETVQTIEASAFADCDKIRYVSVPNLVTLGEQAFAGTGITAFEVGASLNPENPDLNVSEGLAYKAFVGAHSLAEITVADGNASFRALDGVLYRTFVVDDNKVKSEYLELVAYPEAKADGVYTVAENTLRIAAYAFYDAANLEEVTLPVTLKSIGASAFESCDYLSRVIFLSAQAPELGGLYDEETGVNYKNFVSGIDNAGNSHLTAVVPDNAVGYDTYIWKAYFVSFTSSGSSSPTENTLYLVKLIDTIPATVTAADRENIEFCRKLYDSFDSTQQGYVTNLDKLEAAEEALSEIIGDDQPSDSSDSSDSTGSSSSGTSSGTESGGNGGVPAGVIIGIVAGVVVIAAAAVVVVLKLRRRK